MGLDTSTHLSLLALPDKPALLAAFRGKTINEIRTPAAIIDRGILTKNAERVMRDIKARGMGFRVHVKTHKTTEATKIQTQAGEGTKKVIASTLPEIHHLVKDGLIEEGFIDDILYGMPIGADKIHDLNTLQQEHLGDEAIIRLMVDHKAQIEALGLYNQKHGRGQPWSVFIKVDGGGRRAGAPPESQQMKELIEAILHTPSVEIFGFYSHFGQSYASKSLNNASDYFAAEVECVNTAARFARSLGVSGEWTLSVGATPTAHAAASEPISFSNLEGSLELHAGNYCICDMQQYATSLVPPDHLALTVVSRVISVYPERDEALCDCGGLSVSKDRGPITGFGDIISPESGREWYLGGVSQEHGILRRKAGREGQKGLEGGGEGDESRGLGGLEIGDLIRIVPQHACLVCAGHPWIYVVDGGEEIVDVWVPWKGW